MSQPSLRQADRRQRCVLPVLREQDHENGQVLEADEGGADQTAQDRFSGGRRTCHHLPCRRAVPLAERFLLERAGYGRAASYDAERKSNAPEEPVEPPADQSEATPSETEAFTVDDLEDSYSSIFIKRGDLFYRAETATWRYYRTVSFWDESEGFYLYKDPERVAEGNGEDDNPYSVSEIDRAAGDELVIRANVEEYTFYSVLDSAYAGEYRLEDMWIEELNGQPISTVRSVYGDSIREVLAQDGIQVIETIEGDYMISDVPTSCTYGMYSNEAQWGEYTREIDVPVRLINEAEGTCYTVPVIEGREGYFTIDISSLPAGEYFFMASYRRYGQAFYALVNII